MRFRDRKEAGQLLAKELDRRLPADRSDVLVLALPRGGVPVGYEIARDLGLPLDVFVVRKLGVPGHEELAMGAIASSGVRVLNDEVVNYLRVPDRTIDAVTAREERELERREKKYRGSRTAFDAKDHTVIIVDDGLATGSTMRAAVAALRKLGPRRIIVAVPVGAPDTCNDLRKVAEDVICLHTPDPFQAVGLWYEDFSQTSDEEVHQLLNDSSRYDA